MKSNFIWFIIMMFVFTSCTSTQKLVVQGQYDRAIDKGVKKLSKKQNSEIASYTDKAYRLANERDQSQISQLMMEDNEENWERIMQIYQRMNYRQEKIKRIAPITINGNAIQYTFVDYSKKIANAKTNAADFYYNSGISLMEQNTRQAYRDAFYDFQKTAKYAGSKYPDLTSLLNECTEKGTTYVLVSGYNETGGRIPRQYLNNATALSPKALNNRWINVSFNDRREGQKYDYEINLVVNSILVSENGLEEKDTRFSKKVEAGFDYVLDRNGNVMKDSLGNDIKIIRYKNLKCTVIESRQFKSAKVDGIVEIVDLSSNKILSNKPIAADTFFEHNSARAVGDLEALPEEWLEKIEFNKVPYPTDQEIVMETANSLKHAFESFIQNNKKFIL